MKTFKRQKGPGSKAQVARARALTKSLKPLLVTGKLPKITMPVQSQPLPSTRARISAIRAAVNR